MYKKMSLPATAGVKGMGDDHFAAPVPSGLAKGSVYALAENVAEQLGFTPNGDLLNIVDRLGGRILYRNYWQLNDDDSGSLEVDAEGKFRIFVARHTSLERDNFTIAHELGHYILHYLWPLKRQGKNVGRLRASRYGSDRAEWEANWFAAAFLMPEATFRTAYKEIGDNFSALAIRFGVSASAAQTRARALGLYGG